MISRRPKCARAVSVLVTLASLMSLNGCMVPFGFGGGNAKPIVSLDTDGITASAIQPNWQPMEAPNQVKSNQQAFALYRPDLVDPGYLPLNGRPLLPWNYAPALFFGPGMTENPKALPNGAMIWTNGFDSLPASAMPPAQFTVYDLFGASHDVQLGPKQVTPLWNMEQRLKVPLTNNPRSLMVDQRNLTIDLQEVNQLVDLSRDAVVTYFSQAASVDIRNCDIIIEPSIFFVPASNFGSVWAGGLTHATVTGKFRIHVMLFFINSQGTAYDWRDFLMHEVINFYLVSIGRPDLAFQAPPSQER